jgi:hypothetical protein
MTGKPWMRALIVLVLVGAATLGGTSAALAAPSAWWHLTSALRPAILPKGGTGVVSFRALNVGDAPSSGTVTITATLPAGVTVQKTACGRSPVVAECPNVNLLKFPEEELVRFTEIEPEEDKCSEPSTGVVQCVYPEGEAQLVPYEYVEMRVLVDVSASAEPATSTVEASGGQAPPARLTRRIAVGTGAVPYGVEEQGFSIVPEEEGGAIAAQAGAHPYQLTTTFALNQNADTLTPPALTKNLQFTLPPGLVANVASFSQCSELNFLSKPIGGFTDLCPSDSAIGVVVVTLKEPIFNPAPTFSYPIPVFNLTPKLGEPARFGFFFDGIPVTIDFHVRTGGDYGVTATVNNVTETANFLSESLTIWGSPGAASHDASRGWGCLVNDFYSNGGRIPCVIADQAHPLPFLTMPTSCATTISGTVTGESWPFKASPGSTAASISLPPSSYRLEDEFERPLGIVGCNQLPFGPSIEVAPETQSTSTSTGLTVNVRVPQEVGENAGGLASSSVKGITVALPEGVTVNPSGANGLEACSEGQVGFTGFGELNPAGEHGNQTALFTPSLPSPFCPTAAKVATAKITTPLLSEPLEGSVYIATQNENPFGSLIAMYIVAEAPKAGVLVKLPGEVRLSESGQLVTTFANNPQLPFEDAELRFFGGARAPLATPAHCASYATNATFTPWSGTQAVSSQSHFEINSGPGGGGCPSSPLPFSPTLTGGTTNINAGSFSPLITTIARHDGDQDIQSVQLHMPAGLEGIVAGVRLCPEAQANEGTCPAESLIGETTVSAGVGGDPVTVTGGRIYLTEKYAGAPYGLSIVDPVKAGPFDLEHDTANSSQQPACDCLVVRAKVEVNPFTAALTATTDASGPHAIPHMIDGVPVHLRTVEVTINRPGFTFDPTSCDPLAITGTVTGDEGASSSLSEPYQVANCANLKFSPKFAVSTSGKTSKANGASLSVKLTYPTAPFGSQANIAKVKVDLPKQLPSRLTTLQKACLASVFEANPAACPVASIVGHAKVITPVLPVPLEGPAYFVSHGNEAFPSLTMVLQGYGVTVDLVGSTFIKKGITSSTFRATPDVPFNSFELTLPEGPYSALAANGNLCTAKSKLNMPTAFVAQNGQEIHETTKIAVTACRTTAKKPKKGTKSRGARRSTRTPTR